VVYDGILLAKCMKCSEDFKIRSCDKAGRRKTTNQPNVAALIGQMSTGGE